MLDRYVIQCPECGRREDVWRDPCSQILQEGTHEVFCQYCETTYTVETTRVTWFHSPPYTK